MNKNNQNASSSSDKKKKNKKDPSFKFVDMTSEWEPCMSGIRKEKKYFQLRKQLKTCENFQDNYFVISMPKKRKGSGATDEEDDEEQQQDNNVDNSNQQQMQSSMTQYDPSQQIPPNINTSNMNIPIINTRNILRFDNSTPTSNQFTFVPQPVNPPVKTLSNGLVEYNNVKISTASNFDSQKKKKRKSNPQQPPQHSNIQENQHVHNNQQYPPTNTPPHFNSDFIGNASIISADIVNDDFERYHNLSNAQVLDASFIPFTPIDNISMGSVNITANPLPELDTVSISFSEPMSFNGDFNFEDLPDLELFGNVEINVSSGSR